MPRFVILLDVKRRESGRGKFNRPWCFCGTESGRDSNRQLVAFSWLVQQCRESSCCLQSLSLSLSLSLKLYGSWKFANLPLPYPNLAEEHYWVPSDRAVTLGSSFLRLRHIFFTASSEANACGTLVTLVARMLLVAPGIATSSKNATSSLTSSKNATSH